MKEVSICKGGKFMCKNCGAESTLKGVLFKSKRSVASHWVSSKHQDLQPTKPGK